MKLRIAAEEVGRFVAPIANPIGSSLWTARGLVFFGAIKTLAARSAGVPRHAVADFQRLARPVRIKSIAELFDAPHCFVPENNRQRDWQFALPQVHVGAADASHLRAH